MEYRLSLGRKETVRNDEEADVLTASLGCSLAYLRNARRNPKNVRLGASGQGEAVLVLIVSSFVPSCFSKKKGKFPFTGEITNKSHDIAM